MSLNAAGDVQIYSAWIGYSDPGQPLNLTVSAGGDLYLWEASIWGDGGPGSATFQAGGTIEVDFGSSIRMTGDDGVTLRAPTIYSGAGSFSIDSDGPVHLFTDNFNNTGFMTITSWASGTSILMAGDLNPNVGSLHEQRLALNAYGDPARWLVYLTDDAGNVSGLDYSFLQYGTAYPSPPVSAGTGNGVLYSLEAALTVSNTSPITKVYDGTTAVTSTAPGLQVTGLRPGHYISGRRCLRRPHDRQLRQPERRHRHRDRRQRLRSSGHRDLCLRRPGPRLRLHRGSRCSRRHHAANADPERRHGRRTRSTTATVTPPWPVAA